LIRKRFSFYINPGLDPDPDWIGIHQQPGKDPDPYSAKWLDLDEVNLDGSETLDFAVGVWCCPGTGIYKSCTDRFD
jgi:hypothetical protein